MPLTKSKGNVESVRKYQKSVKGRATKKAWRIKNRAKIRRWKLKWAKSENGKKQARDWYRKSPIALYGLYKRSAKKRGISFMLSKKLFLITILKACNYCGYLPIAPDRNGLDRVNNKYGYSVKNVVPCCFSCNQMKGKKTVKEFLRRCAEIILFQEGGINAT